VNLLLPVLVSALSMSGTALCGQTAPATAYTRPASTSSPDREWLVHRFDAWVTSRVDAAVARPANNDAGGIAWGLSYQLNALAQMLQATGDPKYADLFIRLGDHVLAARDDHRNLTDELRKRVVPAWSSTRYSKGRRNAWAVHTGMIAEPMAHFAVAVRADARLHQRFAGDADRFAGAAAESAAVHDDEYREGPGPDESYLFGLFLDKPLPLNQQNAPARVWIRLAQLTAEKQYTERAGRLARFMKNRLRVGADGACEWAYWPGLDGPGTAFEDVSHAAINADFLTLCYERRIVFQKADVDRVARTFLTRVMVAPTTVSDTLSGKGKTNTYAYAPFSWGRLARHSPEVRDRLLAYARYRAGQGEPSDSELCGLAYLVAALRDRP